MAVETTVEEEQNAAFHEALIVAARAAKEKADHEAYNSPEALADRLLAEADASKPRKKH
jgi:hypothetical protein